MEPKTYVFQVMSGRENIMREQALKVLKPEDYETIYIPQIERKHRERGTWTNRKETLFPGYLFVKTACIENVTESLRPVIGWKKLLKTGDMAVPLTESEEHLMNRLMGLNHLVNSSIAYKEGDKVIIIDGPMMDNPGEITYIDRHKRYAMVKIQMFQREITIRLGLEVLSSREEAEALAGQKGPQQTGRQ